MKRTFKYALTAVLASAMANAAMAQSTNFPDVPENHWAYEALARMKKEGLLMGYPDGRYIGSRPATRYELAVAMHAVWINLKTVTDGLETQLKSLEDKVNNMKTGGTDYGPDIANLKAAVDQLKSDMASMKGWGDDIAALKKASSTFEAEFKSMGVDMEAMKKTLADYGDRITTLEKNQLPFTISGDLNFVGLAGYSKDPNFGITTGGRETGFGRGSSVGKPVGANKDLTMLNELGINIKSRDNAAGPQWGVTAVVNNTTGPQAFGNMSTTPLGPFNEGAETLDIHSAWVKFNSSLASLNFSATLGRQGEKIGPLLYQRPDTVQGYYSNDRWENGEYSFDGANVAFGIGPAKLSIFGGRTSGSTAGGDNQIGGGALGQLTAGRTNSPLLQGGPGYRGGVVPVDQQLGVTAGIPLGDKGAINLAYLWLNSDRWGHNPDVPDGVQVYGGDIKFNAAGFGLWGSYAKSDLFVGGSKLLSKKNDAYMVAVSKDFDKLGVKVGYENIAPFFGAPGDWGRVGILGNLTDVKGFCADVHFNLTDSLSLMGGGQWLEGTGDLATGAGFQTDDKFETYKVGLGYKIGSSYDVSLGYETLTAKGPSNNFNGQGNPFFHWYNIGFGWNVSDNAKLKFLWQISDADGKGAFYGQGVSKGGLIGTQFTVKF